MWYYFLIVNREGSILSWHKSTNIENVLKQSKDDEKVFEITQREYELVCGCKGNVELGLDVLMSLGTKIKKNIDAANESDGWW